MRRRSDVFSFTFLPLRPSSPELGGGSARGEGEEKRRREEKRGD
jgi:hypothetical protein